MVTVGCETVIELASQSSLLKRSQRLLRIVVDEPGRSSKWIRAM